MLCPSASRPSHKSAFPKARHNNMQGSPQEKPIRTDGRAADVSVFKGLADDTRLRLLRLLFREELNVQELASILEMGQPRVSRHLGVLRNARLVQDRREGTRVFYTLAPLSDEMGGVSAYIESLGKSEHPDLEGLGEALRRRVNDAQSFADCKAEHWDEIGRLLHNSSASLLAMARLAPTGIRIADLGTGTGLMLPFLSAMADHVYAIDHSARMLERARERCRELGIDNVTFVQRRIEALSDHLPPCDALLLHFVLHQVARPQACLKQAVQFLAPGGRLVVVDRVQHEDEKVTTTFGSLWLGFAEEQLQKWLGRAGLMDSRWYPLAGIDRSVDPHLDIFVACGSKPSATE